MIKKYCDMCEKEIFEEEVNEIFEIKISIKGMGAYKTQTDYKNGNLELKKICKKCKEKIMNIIDGNRVLNKWINEMCIINEYEKTSAIDLFENYKNWANAKNEFVMKNTEFSKALSKQFNKKRNNFGFVYCGIVLKNE
jgi:ribosomal protein L33